MSKNNQVKEPISITAINSISALGTTSAEVWENYCDKSRLFSKMGEDWVSKISANNESVISRLIAENSIYKNLDRTAILAILNGRAIVKSLIFQHSRERQAGSKKAEAKLLKNIGVNIGSSRGATTLFENYHSQFLKRNKVSPFTSPTTTLGNISSWVAQDLGVHGVTIDHSVTCSTAMHSVLNGIAWLQAEMADGFIVGGSEAALTPFTLAQMNALKLSSKSDNFLACESMRFEKTKNTMVLGEGSAMAYLERGVSEKTLAVIAGYGVASERLEHNSSISENADCFQSSMKKALDSAGLKTVDAIVLHAPGTVKGDQAEKNAIDIIFGKQLPLLTSNKWILGHTFGASGMFSIELAVMMLQNNKFIENPYFSNTRHLPATLKTVMINAVGFGGNAVSIIIKNP